VHSRYPEVGMANEGATLAAQKLQASWAAEAATDAAASPAPAPAQPPAPALLSVPVTGETPPSHGGGPAPRSPGPAQAAPALPGPAPIAP
jgi:hypothetical protein